MVDTMHFLLSNDDGYQAPGLSALAEALKAFGEVTVVAPDRDRSGASNSLTLSRPLRINKASNGFYYVDGTPTDCVHLGITGVMQDEPDMVIAGINHGPNLGDDILYSGTVAAAMEGRFLGYPAVAISFGSSQMEHLSTAARVVRRIVNGMICNPLPGDTILNINIPDVRYDRLMGFKATRLGYRHKSEPAIKSHDPGGAPIYWVGPPGAAQDAGEGTDFDALRNHAVSVTPLKVDLTRKETLTGLGQWLRDLAQ
jgi:5'-nucleotidase